MRQVRATSPRVQTWRTFIHTHAQQIWACDFLPVTDLFFRSLFVFFLIELKSRKVIHAGVTRSPTDAWTGDHPDSCVKRRLEKGREKSGSNPPEKPTRCATR